MSLIKNNTHRIPERYPMRVMCGIEIRIDKKCYILDNSPFKKSIAFTSTLSKPRKSHK